MLLRQLEVVVLVPGLERNHWSLRWLAAVVTVVVVETVATGVVAVVVVTVVTGVVVVIVVAEQLESK